MGVWVTLSVRAGCLQSSCCPMVPATRLDLFLHTPGSIQYTSLCLILAQWQEPQARTKALKPLTDFLLPAAGAGAPVLGYLGTGIIFNPFQQLTNHKKALQLAQMLVLPWSREEMFLCVGKNRRNYWMNGHRFYFLSLPGFLSVSLCSLDTLKLLDSAAGRCVYALVQTVCVSLAMEIEMVGQMVSATNKSSSAVVQFGTLCFGKRLHLHVEKLGHCLFLVILSERFNSLALKYLLTYELLGFENYCSHSTSEENYNPPTFYVIMRTG